MYKILNNYNKSKRLNGTKRGKVGTELKIMDKNGNNLKIGDTIMYGEYKGVILYNPKYKEYGVAIENSMWYGTDKYDIKSYGKFVAIPMDNGARMEIEQIEV